MKNMLKIGALAISSLLFTSTLYAAPIQWTLENAAFDNGERLVGSFVYDADTDLFSAVNVSVTSSTGTPIATYSTACEHSNLFELFATSVACSPINSTLNVVYIEFEDELTNDGGLLELDDDTTYGTCENVGCTRVTSSIQLVSGQARGVPYITPTTPSAPTSVPTLNEWSLLLLASLMAGLVFWRQRRT